MESEELFNRLSQTFSTFSTKPIMFVGSGISKRYLDLPNWELLITEFTKRLRPDDIFSYRHYENKASLILQEESLSPQYLLPVIAELVEIEYNLTFFEDTNFETEIKKTYENEIILGQSPFRLAIIDYLAKKRVYTIDYENEHLNFHRLKDKVSNLITTNYDTFLEEVFTNYDVLVGQQDLLNRNPSSIGVIYKIHGSVENPSSMVLTRSDYQNFDKKLKYLSAKLLTHFVEFPMILIGYGVGDSNIRSILKDIKICLNHENSENLSNQLLFIDRTDNPEKQDIVTTEIEDIRMTKVILHDYNILYNAFDSIIDTIDIKTLRRIEKKIVQLVQSTNSQVERVYATSLENKELTDDNLAIYIGNDSSVFELGYSGIRLLNICEDVLFDKKGYDPKGIIESSILNQKSYFGVSKLPIYKYLKDYPEEILDDFYKKNNRLITKIDDIYNKQEKGTRLYKHPIKDISHIIGSETDLNIIIKNIYLSLGSLDISKVKEYIKSIWTRKEDIHPTTYLTKIVCVIDFVENKKNIE